MKKEKILTIAGILVLCVALVSSTFAYFSAQAGGTTTRDVSVTSNTTDNLSFSISNDISFTASTANFYQGGNNAYGEATATATLTPNNKTNQATMNYYMYLNLTSNPITYSSTNTNEDPELILQVFDENDELVTLTGLGSQVSLGNGYGYDITGQSGLITLLDNHTITATNATEVETWRVVITLVNLGVDQNDNGGKTVTGEIIMQKEGAAVIPNNIQRVMKAYNLTEPGSITLTNGMLYYHDDDLEDGVEDYSYRYSGEDPNNYVCFGSTDVNCPDDNIYRIIGVIPTEVVVDETNPNNIVTETQYLYKLIRNEFETESTLNTPSGDSFIVDNKTIYQFAWHKTYDNDYEGDPDNTWSESELNTIGLNTIIYNSMGSAWTSKIAKVVWIVGGYANWGSYHEFTNGAVYSNEITYSGIGSSYAPSDNATEYIAKIGLMYVSDFYLAGLQESWSYTPYDYCYDAHNFFQNNWFKHNEWTITRDGQTDDCALNSTYGTDSAYGIPVNYYCPVRRVFYLTEDTVVDMTNHAGTFADPYRIL